MFGEAPAGVRGRRVTAGNKKATGGSLTRLQPSPPAPSPPPPQAPRDPPKDSPPRPLTLPFQAFLKMGLKRVPAFARLSLKRSF